MEGEEGYNNRVELEIGDFLVTHHHQSKCDKLPENFVNLSSLYSKSNASLNDELQLELFPSKDVVSEAFRRKLLNLVILHEKGDSSPFDIGKIEFVFPKNSRKFISLNIAELVKRQGDLMDLGSADLFDFKRKSAEEFRRLVG